tara:strand:- start:408 stop:941 length:534 start_codon:yes stop_codon:yes gene_type:complete
MTDKGGCKVGKKAPEGSPKGGCKEGLKAKPKKKLVLRLQPLTAKKITSAPSNAETAKVIAPKKRVPMTAKVMKAKPKKKLVLKEKPKKTMKDFKPTKKYAFSLNSADAGGGVEKGWLQDLNEALAFQKKHNITGVERTNVLQRIQRIKDIISTKEIEARNPKPKTKRFLYTNAQRNY